MVQQFWSWREAKTDRRSSRPCDRYYKNSSFSYECSFLIISLWICSSRCQTHKFCWISKLQNNLSTVRWLVLLHLCWCIRQQFILSRSHSQLCWSSEWLLPQCLRVRSGVQLLQSLYYCRWNVLGWRAEGNQSNQSIETTHDVKLSWIVNKVSLKSFYLSVRSKIILVLW